MNCILLSATAVYEQRIVNPEQVKHISGVLKAKVGNSLTIGEVDGQLGTAIISDIKATEITLTDITLHKPPPDKLDLTVVLALPRPKVLRRLVIDMTALGANKIILLNSYRTQKSYWQSPLLNRLDEFIYEGLQQAVDTVPPVIELKKRFKPFVEDEFLSLSAEKTSVVAHPYSSQSWQSYLSNLKKSEQEMPKVLCIGAEGGWIDYEVDLLSQHGCIAVSLGNRILRTESAVNVMLGSWLS